MSAVNEGAMRQANPMLTCAQCALSFPAPPFRRGKVQIYCSSQCQTKAANARRATTREGRKTNPQVVEPSGRPSPSTLPNIPPSVDMAASEPQSSRLAVLMAKAHSREGIDAWEVAELAKLRNISPWSPLRIIIAKDCQPRRKP
jgi:hypothetical protein